MIRTFGAATLAFALLAGVASAPLAQPGAPHQPSLGAWGYDLAGRDPSVAPGNDFFRYANGAYLKTLVIPPDRSRFGSFDQLSELSQSRVRDVLVAASTTPPQNHDAQIIGAAYKAYLDEPRLEALDAKPLAPDLAAIRSADTREKLAVLMGHAPDGYFDAIFDLGIDADPKNPDRYAISLSQAGLGLPDRDYYLKPSFAPQKAKYQAYVAQMLQMAGWPDPEANAAAIVAFETRIAEASWSKVEQRDPVKSYNPMTVAQLQAAAPGFAWRPFLDAAGLPGRDRLIVAENTAVPKIAAIFAETPLPTLQAWEAFGVIDSAAPFLSKRFVDARFAFRDKILSGQLEQKPRWKLAAAAIDRGMGEAVGQVYVAKYFSPEAKAKITALIGDLKTALGGRIQRLDWMSPETKAKALEKLSLLTVKVGYPDKWRDYASLQISPDDLFGDIERAEAFEWRREVNRLDQPVDKTEWGMTPQTVNAYYNPVNNEIVFPAAILQPPFFDPNADAAVNFGGVGAVIGHEMDARLRRRGAAVRRPRTAHRLVDGGGRGQVRGPDQAARRAIQRLRARRGLPRQRRPHHGREHRGPGRDPGGAGRLSRVAGRQARAGDRRLDGRPALLPGLRPDLAQRRSRRRRPPPAGHRPALPARGPGQRCGSQCGRLVPQLRREAGRDALCRAGTSACASGDRRVRS